MSIFFFVLYPPSPTSLSLILDFTHRFLSSICTYLSHIPPCKRFLDFPRLQHLLELALIAGLGSPGNIFPSRSLGIPLGMEVNTMGHRRRTTITFLSFSSLSALYPYTGESQQLYGESANEEEQRQSEEHEEEEEEEEEVECEEQTVALGEGEPEAVTGLQRCTRARAARTGTPARAHGPGETVAREDPPQVSEVEEGCRAVLTSLSLSLSLSLLFFNSVEIDPCTFVQFMHNLQRGAKRTRGSEEQTSPSSEGCRRQRARRH